MSWTERQLPKLIASTFSKRGIPYFPDAVQILMIAAPSPQSGNAGPIH